MKEFYEQEHCCAECGSIGKVVQMEEFYEYINSCTKCGFLNTTMNIIQKHFARNYLTRLEKIMVKHQQDKKYFSSQTDCSFLNYFKCYLLFYIILCYVLKILEKLQSLIDFICDMFYKISMIILSFKSKFSNMNILKHFKNNNILIIIHKTLINVNTFIKILKVTNASSVIFATIIFNSLTLSEGFCPNLCTCNDVSLTVNCTEVRLDVIPYLLNPHIETLLLPGNRISHLYQSLEFYTNLQNLDLSHNHISEIESSNFEAQNSLHQLYLDNNRISVLGNSSFVGAESMVKLNLSCNEISQLKTQTFIGIPKLCYLYLSKNKIKIISENVFRPLKQLKILDMSSNNLKYVPTSSLADMSNLKELNLCNNQISKVPDRAFIGMSNLFVLKLNKNNISQITSNAFIGLSSLSSLYLIDNRLSTVPSSSFIPLVSVTFINLSGNLFESLGKDILSNVPSVTNLIITRCPRLVTIGSDAFLSGSSLETLQLSHNPRLVTLHRSALAPLLNLRHLDLTACGIGTLMPNQVPLDHLKSLSLSGNPLHCNCSLLWLTRLPNNSTTNSHVTLDRPTCATPPTLYGVALQDVGQMDAGCDVGIGVWTIMTCVAVVLTGFLIIAAFLAWRWRKKSTSCKPLRLATTDDNIMRRNFIDGFERNGQYINGIERDGRLINGIDRETHFVNGLDRDGQFIQLCPSYSPTHSQLYSNHQICGGYKLCPQHGRKYSQNGCEDCHMSGLHAAQQPLLQSQTCLAHTIGSSPVPHPQAPGYTAIPQMGSPAKGRRTPLSHPALPLTSSEWLYSNAPLDNMSHWYATIGGDDRDDLTEPSSPVILSSKVPPSPIMSPSRYPPSPMTVSTRVNSSPRIPPSPVNYHLKPQSSPRLSHSSSQTASPATSSAYTSSPSHNRIPITYI